MKESDAGELVLFLRTMADEIEKDRTITLDVAQEEQATLF